MLSYIALIHKDADSEYGVSFPDLPGCISAGATLDEARAMAAEALAMHLEGLIADAINRDAVAVLIDAPDLAVPA